ncbi:hypothetical protein B296_00016701 [Ensete ventricosum]|uniref:Uncharacterized protein n=1 Tax=Ensete ventricosum TaxID=4639 RepID=A0A427ALJ5_ENSVE|nr:hypothetical protein B296_00016701 [Ensete ventricosum]
MANGGRLVTVTDSTAIQSNNRERSQSISPESEATGGSGEQQQAYKRRKHLVDPSSITGLKRDRIDTIDAIEDDDVGDRTTWN